MSPRKEALIREWFAYEPRTGLVRWKKTASNRAVAGSVAGCDRAGYVRVRLAGHDLGAHQIAFALMRGHIPTLIDHRDCDGTNNRWRNLRAGNHSLNRANASVRSDSLVGLKGVTRRPNGKFQARIRVDNRRVSLGDHLTAAAAHAAYVRAARLYFGEFAHA